MKLCVVTYEDNLSEFSVKMAAPEQGVYCRIAVKALQMLCFYLFTIFMYNILIFFLV